MCWGTSVSLHHHCVKRIMSVSQTYIVSDFFTDLP
jgi:hypothetical protein